MHYYRDPDSPSQLAADEGTRQHKRRAPKAVYDEMNRLQRSAQSSPLPPHGDADIRRVLYPKVLDDSFLQPNRHSSKGNKGILPHPRHLLHGHLLHGFSQDVLKASSLACHSITHPAAPVRRQASGKLAPPDPIQIYSRSSQAISIYLSIDRSIDQSSTHAHTHTRTHAHTHTHTHNTQLIRQLVVAGALCLSEHLCDRPVCDTVIASAPLFELCPASDHEYTGRTEGLRFSGWAELAYEAWKRALHLCSLVEGVLEGHGLVGGHMSATVDK